MRPYPLIRKVVFALLLLTGAMPSCGKDETTAPVTEPTDVAPLMLNGQSKDPGCYERPGHPEDCP